MKYELRGVHLIQIPLCLQCVFHLILFVSIFVFVFVFVLFCFCYCCWFFLIMYGAFCRAMIFFCTPSNTLLYTIKIGMR